MKYKERALKVSTVLGAISSYLQQYKILYALKDINNEKLLVTYFYNILYH